MPTKQVINGKAFEFALALNYYRELSSRGLATDFVVDAEHLKCKDYYENRIQASERLAFDTAAQQTIDTLTVLEPGLISQANPLDVLTIRLTPDSAGNQGDVRDVIFARNGVKPRWEIGISAKNNSDAAKHSRLSPIADFGNEWLGYPCSTNYFTEVNAVFGAITSIIRTRRGVTWKDVSNISHAQFYVPTLNAFKKELLALNAQCPDVPQKLIGYLVGRYSFYKVIKYDANNLVVVKAFNTHGGLHRPVNGNKARSKSSRLNLPSRIIEFDFKPGSQTTLLMVLDNGWQISFRIHSADGPLNTSLKFDAKLTGNPPVLFTQHLFT